MSAAGVPQVPIIDIGPFVRGAGDQTYVAGEIARACSGCAFFSVTGHAVARL